MKKYFQYAGADLSSAIVVSLVALPLCIGIALASGAPLFAGIIGGFIGGLVVGTLSGSQVSISGPAAGLIVIVASGIARLPAYETFLLAVVLAGIFQIVLGYVKAGVVGDYIPYCVITGILAAIGLILILKQIPHFMGDDTAFEGDESFVQENHENTFTSIISSFRNLAPLAIIIGTSAILIQLLWDKVLIAKVKMIRFIPAPLIAVLVAIAINRYFLNIQHPWALKDNHLVNIPVAKTFEAFTTFFFHPEFSHINEIAVWTTALTIAIVASLETLINIEAANELDPFKRVPDTNRELKAQGIGNIVSGLLGGLPLTSVIVRSSVNVNSGAKTKMSAIMHGGLLYLSASFIPGLLNYIPLAALAGVLIYIGLKLAKPAIFIELFKKGYDQFLPFLITILAILFTDFLTGVLIGIAAGLFFVLRSNFRTSVFIVNDGNNYLVRLRKDVSFLNKPILKRKLENVPENCHVIIDATRADFIDKDVIEVINDYLRHAHLKNIQVEIKKSIHKPVHQLFETAVKQTGDSEVSV